jgi:hypothetical protein
MGKTAMGCNYPDFPVAVQDKKTGIKKKKGEKGFSGGPTFSPKR